MKLTRKLGAVALAAVLTLGPAGPAGANQGTRAPKVVGHGLDNPRGLTWGPDDTLLVAEAGRGGQGTCVGGVFTGNPMCFGRSGAVTQIKRNGEQRRIVTGLPSIAESGTGTFAFGPSDVSAGNGDMYVSVGGPGPQLDRSVFRDRAASTLGTVQRVSHGRKNLIADLAAYELANDPDAQLHESNPTSVLRVRGVTFAIDAAGNTFFSINRSGDLTLLKTFENRSINGTTYQAVPTALAEGPDGAIYISDLTGVPFPSGESKVWRWTPAGMTVFAEGFTTATDLAFGPDGSLYVLEIFPGRVTRLSPDGSRDVVIDTDAGLTLPYGIAIGRDGSIYVTNCGNCQGTGSVLRFRG